VQAAIPGDAAEVRVGPRPDLTIPQRQLLIANERRALGLDRPLWVQYGKWIARAARLDFGTTVSGERVSTTVETRLGPTIELAVVAQILSIPPAIWLALRSARRKPGLLTRAADAVFVAGFVVPAFWLGLLLVLVFAVWLRVLPASGYVSFTSDPIQHIRLLVLPVCTLAVSQLAMYYKFVQQGLREALRSQYVRTARAKGLSEADVLWHHALRNALLPMVTILGLTLASLIGGIIVVEQIFSWPGVGALLLYSVARFDYNTLVAIVLITAIAYVVISLSVDATHRILDPRIRRG
jgi:peptide/nickel transport system permease protein